jgi:hypothetical protein
MVVWQKFVLETSIEWWTVFFFLQMKVNISFSFDLSYFQNNHLIEQTQGRIDPQILVGFFFKGPPKKKLLPKQKCWPKKKKKKKSLNKTYKGQWLLPKVMIMGGPRLPQRLRGIFPTSLCGQSALGCIWQWIYSQD